MALTSFPALVASVVFFGVLPPDPDDVLRVPEALMVQAKAHIAEPAQSREQRLELLVDFVSEPDHLGFSYRGDATHTVAETFNERHGNCLSFTLLFLSLSRALGLDSHAREVAIPPAWQDEGQTLFEVGHINVGVDTPTRRRTVDFDPDSLRSQRLAAPWRGQAVSDQRALAHFYNNRAAELLADGHARLSGLWVHRALELDPSFHLAWNTQGVIERQLGQLEQAKRSFESALDLAPESATTLFNLIALAEQQGLDSSAAYYQARLNALHPNDPWFQWQLGRRHQSQGRIGQALAAFRRAFEREPHQPRIAQSLIELLETTDQSLEAARIQARVRPTAWALVGDEPSSKPKPLERLGPASDGDPKRATLNH